MHRRGGWLLAWCHGTPSGHQRKTDPSPRNSSHPTEVSAHRRPHAKNSAISRSRMPHGGSTMQKLKRTNFLLHDHHRHQEFLFSTKTRAFGQCLVVASAGFEGTYLSALVPCDTRRSARARQRRANKRFLPREAQPGRIWSTARVARRVPPKQPPCTAVTTQTRVIAPDEAGEHNVENILLHEEELCKVALTFQFSLDVIFLCQD